MDTATLVSLMSMAAVVVGSAMVNFFGTPSRSTSDFLAAGRSVGTVTNAAAISGEFLSAASFLGIAGLVLRDGADALWYPIGFTAGYLALLLFIAGPIRRSGAYSMSDFADARLGHSGLRRVCTLFTVIVGSLVMLPQLQGAGLTVATVTRLPSWTGAVAAAVVIMATMLFGGLRSMTLVQAVQFFIKTVALAVPAIVVSILFLSDHDGPPSATFPQPTTVQVRTDVTLHVPQPVTVQVSGMADGAPLAGSVEWAPGPHTVTAGSALTFPAGAAAPVPTAGGDPEPAWISPLSHRGEHSLLATYSLLAALFLGTLGLPNVLARFYTNADGRAARRTAVTALALVGGFSLLPVVLGALARYYTPQLLISGDTDAAVLLLPSGAMSGLGADLLTGLVAAGAWAAFLSAGTGLAVSVAGVVHTDVLRSGPGGFRIAAVIVTAVPLLLTLQLDRLPLAETIALAFAVAASTFCPLLLLGIWWRGLTTPGAIAGMLVGGVTSTAAVCATIAGVSLPGVLGVLLHQPTAVTAPAAFLVMIVISNLTYARRPTDADSLLLRLHAPERLGLGRPVHEEA